jgi:hypothetical protein
MVRLRGNLKDLFGALVNYGSLNVQLCGFDPQLPRVAGTGLLANIAPIKVECPLGTYDFTIYGNDVITPANTYYAITVLDDRNNVVQAAAYQFANGVDTALDQVAPYDPASGFVPPAPGVVAGTVIVPYGLNPNFDASLIVAGVITFEMTLTGNVNSSAILNVTPGQIITFIITQDGVGGRTFVWPANALGGTIVNPDVNGVTTQSYVVRSNGTLLATSAGTYN